MKKKLVEKRDKITQNITMEVTDTTSKLISKLATIDIVGTKQALTNIMGKENLDGMNNQLKTAITRLLA